MLYSNCMDCPHHLVVNDPDPTDSFNDDDVAVLCTKTLNHSQRHYYAYKRLFEYEPITVSCRPHYKRKESITPKWCPILKKAKKEELEAHSSHCSGYFDSTGKQHDCPICRELEERRKKEMLEEAKTEYIESSRKPSYIKELNMEFLKRIDKKNSWGKNEIKTLFLETLNDVLISQVEK